MAWDDELEQLTNQVHDLLGRDVLSAAVSRAISAALQQARPVELSSSLEVRGISDSDGYWTSMSVFYDALTIELRRLLQPH
jgi:hypothetical protein